MVTKYAILSGSVYALIGISFFLPYITRRFFDLAHAAVFTWGAYFGYYYAQTLHLTFLYATILASLSCGLLGLLNEIFFLGPIRKRTIGRLAPLLASLGLYVILQNIVSVCFGDDVKLMLPGSRTSAIIILGFSLTNTQWWTIACTIMSVLIVWGILNATRLGRGMRCLAQDSFLAKACGINTSAVQKWACFIGSSLCGLAGILVGTDTAMVPTMGLNMLMISTVAVVLGQKWGVLGIVVCALFLAFAQRGGAYLIGAQWQDAIALLVLLLFLAVGPARLVRDQ